MGRKVRSQTLAPAMVVIPKLGLKECHSKIAFEVPTVSLSQLPSPDKGLVVIYVHAQVLWMTGLY